MSHVTKIIASSIAIIILIVTASAEDEISFEPAEVSISGRLLGNYVMLSSGEMLKGHILYLNEKIDIAGNDNSTSRKNRKTVRNIDRVLLEFQDDGPSDDFAGATVEVRGKLFNKPSDPHHTRVMMIVEEVSLLSETEADQPVATFKTH